MKKDVAQLVLGAMKQIVEGNVMQSLGKSEWTIQEALVQYQSIAAKAYADLAADIAQPVEPIGHIVCGDLVQVDDGVEQEYWSVDLDHGPIEKLSAANPGERIAIYAEPQEAAAPEPVNAELLAALQDCLLFLENDCGCGNSVPEILQARAAIGKATGSAT